MLRSLISFIRAESAAYTTEYSVLVTEVTLHGVGCGYAAYTRSRASPLCVFCVSQQFPMSQANADIKFREQCLSESQKKEQNRKTQKLKRNTHTQATATATGDWREGQKEQRGKMAMLAFGLPDPCYNLSCTQKGEERGG